MNNSTHRAEVFRIKHIDAHPNADRLSIVRIFDNYRCIIRTTDFKINDLAVFVTPDSVLPDKPEYAFLKGHLRIKAQKLRGITSQGLILPAPPDAQEGDDVAERLGITHYVPGSSQRGPSGSGGGGNHGDVIAGPLNPGDKYDVDSWFRYGSLIPEGTEVEITEKLDGTNVRASYQEGKFWMSSREHYRKESSTGLYWRVMHENLWLKRLCKQNPGCIVYGEAYGNVQSLKYGAEGDQIFFRVFDILTPHGYMHYHEKLTAMKNAMVPSIWERLRYALKQYVTLRSDLSIPEPNWTDCYVPILYVGPYKKEVVEQLMCGPSQIPCANHVKEGCVIKPVIETYDSHIGRLILKAVSPEYLELA